MGADHSFYVKTIETHARAFLPLNISAIGTVAETANLLGLGHQTGNEHTQICVNDVTKKLRH